MEAKKLYIKSVQKLSFKAFAIIAFILLFISQRLHFLKITELELNNVSDTFGLSEIAFGKTAKFFDYFGVAFPSQFQIGMYISIGLLVLGLAVLVMSFFGYRAIQVVNFVISFVGFALSIVFAVIMTVLSVQGNGADVDEIMEVSVNFIVWLPAVFFLIGSVFTYAYAKMPGYSLAEGRFCATFFAALNPKCFLKTFQKEDNTESLFRSRVPLKKKKYATLGEPKAIKKSKKANKKQVNKRKNTRKCTDDTAKAVSPIKDKKLTSLQIALAKREHAERIANVRADEENRALFVKQKNSAAQNKESNVAEISKKSPKKNRSASSKAKAFERAKRRAEHAEMVASRNDEIFY